MEKIDKRRFACNDPDGEVFEVESTSSRVRFAIDGKSSLYYTFITRDDFGNEELSRMAAFITHLVTGEDEEYLYDFIRGNAKHTNEST